MLRCDLIDKDLLSKAPQSDQEDAGFETDADERASNYDQGYDTGDQEDVPLDGKDKALDRNDADYEWWAYRTKVAIILKVRLRKDVASNRYTWKKAKIHHKDRIRNHMKHAVHQGLVPAKKKVGESAPLKKPVDPSKKRKKDAKRRPNSRKVE